MKLSFSILISTCIIIIACNNQSFEDQIKNDISSKLATGICDSIPKGSIISNIVVGEIVDIGLQGMTDVSYELDFEHNGTKKHRSSAMLYIKQGSRYKLASIGGCEYEMN